MHPNKSPLEAQIFLSVRNCQTKSWRVVSLHFVSLLGMVSYFLLQIRILNDYYQCNSMRNAGIWKQILSSAALRSLSLQYVLSSFFQFFCWRNRSLPYIPLLSYIPSFFSFLRAPLRAFSSMLRNSRNSEYPCHFPNPDTLHLKFLHFIYFLGYIVIMIHDLYSGRPCSLCNLSRCSIHGWSELQHGV